jgi:hypothetical protein
MLKYPAEYERSCRWDSNIDTNVEGTGSTVVNWILLIDESVA